MDETNLPPARPEPEPAPQPPRPPEMTVCTLTKEEALKEFREIDEGITKVANAIPTPNVLDSHLHSKMLHDLATRVRRFIKLIEEA
jgi:hypothetical protein